MKLPISRWFCVAIPILSLAATPVAATDPAAADVKLTGITALSGVKQALLLVREPAAPGEAPKAQESFMLGEGQSAGSVQVLRIDQSTGQVKIRNGIREMELSLSMNGVPAPTAAPQPAAPRVIVEAFTSLPPEDEPRLSYDSPKSDVIVIGRASRQPLKPVRAGRSGRGPFSPWGEEPSSGRNPSTGAEAVPEDSSSFEETDSQDVQGATNVPPRIGDPVDSDSPPVQSTPPPKDLPKQSGGSGGLSASKTQNDPGHPRPERPGRN